MEVICSICGSEGGPRSYISNLDLEENSSILKWFLHLEVFFNYDMTHNIIIFLY